MADRLTLAMQEAYAVAPVDALLIHTVALDHPAFTAPVILASGVEEDLVIHLENGAAVTAIACAFEVTPPGFDDHGPTSAKLSVDNVSGLLYPHLRAAIGASVPVSVTYRAYRSDQLQQPGEVIEGLQLKSVTVSSTTAEGELTFAEVATQAFPRRTYDLDTYPGLWNR